MFYRKNAVEMAKSGGGPQVDVTFKSGGKSVEELTGTFVLIICLEDRLKLPSTV